VMSSSTPLSRIHVSLVPSHPLTLTQERGIISYEWKNSFFILFYFLINGK
jgi:hypothetical protein